MHTTLIVVPTYNEKENIEKLVTELLNLRMNADILIVDDGKDGTDELVRTLQQSTPELKLIKRAVKSGRGTAVLEGLKYGLQNGYEYLVEMDADLSHDPKELPLLMKEASADRVVIGSRYVRGSKILNWPLKRRIFSKCANFYAGLVLGIGIKDYTDGYRVYGRAAAEKIDFDRIKSTGYIVLSEVAYQLFLKGTSFAEVPIIFVNRSRGASNFSMNEIKESLFAVLRIRKEYGTEKRVVSPVVSAEAV